MATSQTCCHLPGKMLNSAAECADRARIENESSTVNCNNNTGKPSVIHISTENERNSASENESDNLTGNTSGHFITRFLSSTSPSYVVAAGTGETGPCQSRTWAALLTQSMSILSGGGYGSEILNANTANSFNESESIENKINYLSFESYHTPTAQS
jgi:hypothetical protein